ncbi:hypothetical protein ACQKII_03355 [Lysinibacillus sp. NPDC048646]|uniref:hypothetical protein n=1 Tax=Lysinibacillus sp. NPDC048646 TaxID=3390574 RepID=UPI003D074DFF
MYGLLCFYPALTVSNLSVPKAKRQVQRPPQVEKGPSQLGGRSTDRKSPIGSGQQDVGHTSFFTGCEGFSLCSSIYCGG